MNPQRTPRQVPDPEETASPAGRRRFYEQILRACKQPPSPHGLVAMVLLEVIAAPAPSQPSARILQSVTSKLAAVLNRRLRSVDMLARSGDTELAVLLAQAHLGVAAAFSERLRQPIEQAVRELALARETVVCMGLAANPSGSWHPDELIELADYRMRRAKQRAMASSTREWVLEVEGESIPQTWADSTLWPATAEISSYSSL